MSTVTPPNTASAVPIATGVAPKRWTREEYYRLADEGFFQGQRVELIGGQIVVMSPQSFSHTFSADILGELLKDLLGDGYWVRVQAPLSMPNESEPEPDVSVVAGSRDDYSAHPTTAALVVEVAKTALDYDTKTKPGVYASAAIPEYWVLDLNHRRLIVHRDPVEDPAAEFGHRYREVSLIEESGNVAPLGKSSVSLSVAKMLPPKK